MLPAMRVGETEGVVQQQRPVAGQVVRFGYLWSEEWDEGHDSPRKPGRPCLVVSVRETEGGYRVTLVPITRTIQFSKFGVEVPKGHHRQAGLEDGTMYAVASEVNVVSWPLEKHHGAWRSTGYLPEGFVSKVRRELVRVHGLKKLKAVRRDGRGRDRTEIEPER